MTGRSLCAAEHKIVVAGRADVDAREGGGRGGAGETGRSLLSAVLDCIADNGKDILQANSWHDRDYFVGTNQSHVS